jgi:hypothetical protein
LNFLVTKAPLSVLCGSNHTLRGTYNYCRFDHLFHGKSSRAIPSRLSCVLFLGASAGVFPEASAVLQVCPKHGQREGDASDMG